jgi:Bardet-Biedl syndrome 5 protein
MSEEEEVAPFWQDREIRFDVSAEEFEIRPGEQIIDTLNLVEDTKGNNGKHGMLHVTNLRLLWHCDSDPSINLSIGFGCCLNLSINTAESRLRGGTTQALYVSAKFPPSRYEFTFTYLVPQSPRLFTTVLAVWKAYDTSRIYRDLKLRSAIVNDQELVLLPGERVFTKLDGVWNLSSDQGNLGNFYITNVRAAWFASLSENFNVSIPYVQITAVKLRDSKFGQALVIETSIYAGSYVLGFLINPPERLPEVFQEVQSLWKAYTHAPVLGVDYQLEEVPESLEQNTVTRVIDGLNVVVDAPTDAFAAYYADEGQKNCDRMPVYDKTIGLAVEKLRDGTTLESLWKVVV